VTARAPAQLRPASGPVLRRACACGGTPGHDGECASCKRKRLARAAAAGAPPVAASLPPAVGPVLASPGRPLEPPLRRRMESQLGHDFSDVRVHADARAADSARAVGALAYTVGRDVVLGGGGAGGERLLAHELAHVVQQRGSGPPRPEAVDEAEAERAAAGVGAASAASGPVLRRQAFPTAAEQEKKAAAAEAACDIGALCSIHWASPAVVTVERVRATAQRCSLTTGLPLSTTGNPCLTVGLVTPLPTPTPSPTTIPSAPPPAKPTSGPSIESLTHFKYTAGPVKIDITLPKEATVSLPLALKGRQLIDFRLKAETSGKFSFEVVLDGVPYVQIGAQASLSTEGEGTVGLAIGAKRKVCKAADRDKVKSDIKAAEAKLVTAVNALAGAPPTPPLVLAPSKPPEGGGPTEGPVPQLPPPGLTPKLPATPPPATDTGKQMLDVAKAIGELYDATSKLDAKCKEVPVFQIDIGAKTQLIDPSKPEDRKPTVFGVGLTVPF
jgi:hypothetical protein